MHCCSPPHARFQQKLHKWLPHRDTFLDEILRYDGLRAVSSDLVCENCRTAVGEFRCQDCYPALLLCKDCLLGCHLEHPLHRIEKFNSRFFEKTSLKSLGYTVQLGHYGGLCTAPSLPYDLQITHINGVHDVCVYYCDCHAGGTMPPSRLVQLLRHGWYPASTHRPRTVFTFDILDFFQELNLQGKTMLYDFSATMHRFTDNSGALNSTRRYQQFAVVVRQWRHLKVLKRAGRGHDPAGPSATNEGDLEQECPACPHRDRNIPSGMENSLGKEWMNEAFLMMDANFRIRSKDRGFDDMQLAPGWGYVVESGRLNEFLNLHTDKVEDNHCSAEHKAILKSHLRKDGYLASGVGAVLCARHAIVCKAGDIPLGEKFPNMDLILLLALKKLDISHAFISYDIVCSYNINFDLRNQAYAPDVQLDMNKTTLCWGIPKKHYPVHGPGHARFCLNFLPNVGRMYGEGIESGWNHWNPLGLSAQEMAPGMRHEVLNDHFGSWNWQKILSFGHHLRRCHKDARTMRNRQRIAFEEFSQSFPLSIVQEWQGQVEAWEANHNARPDPYEEPASSVTLNSVCLQLAQEDAKATQQGVAREHEMSSGNFLAVGLELEEQQRQIMAAPAGKTDKQRADHQDKINVFLHRVEHWRTVQTIYMPIAAALALNPPSTSTIPAAADSDTSSAPSPESRRLGLPSSLPVDILALENMKKLGEKEMHLRIAQAEDTLSDIRRYRRMILGASDFRHLNVSGTGQAAQTRSRALFTKLCEKISRAAARYRAARFALVLLDPAGTWAAHLKPLRDSDISGPARDFDDEDKRKKQKTMGPGEGRHEVSWIWRMPFADGSLPDQRPADSNEFSAAMRVEWARARARAARWAEEVELLEIDMHRTVLYLRWKANWWRQQRDRRVRGPAQLPAPLVSGLLSYAEKQVAIFDNLAVRFARLWIPYFLKIGSAPAWASLYPDLLREYSKEEDRAAAVMDSGSSSSEEDVDM